MMKRLAFFVIIIISLAIVLSSGCISQNVTYKVVTTTSVTKTTATTVVYHITTTKTSFITMIFSSTTTVLTTSYSTMYSTVTITVTSTTGITSPFIHLIIYTVPIDNDGKPNIVVYSPISRQLIYLTGSYNLTVCYYSPFKNDRFVLPMFSYVDLKYYKSNSFNRVVPTDPVAAASFVQELFITSADPFANPASFIHSKTVPANVLYDWLALYGIFESVPFAYVYIGSSVGMEFSTFYVMGYSVYANNAAFSVHYNGTIATFVSFYPGDPFATVIITPIALPGVYSSFFPKTYSFFARVYRPSTTFIVSGTKMGDTWYMVRTVVSGTYTGTEFITFFNNTMIQNQSTFTLNSIVFYSSYIPIPLHSLDVFYLDSNEYVVSEGLNFVTVSKGNVSGYWSGTITIYER